MREGGLYKNPASAVVRDVQKAWRLAVPNKDDGFPADRKEASYAQTFHNGEALRFERMPELGEERLDELEEHVI